VTPQEFASHLNRRFAGTMMQGIEMLDVGEGCARGRIEFKPGLTQLTGMFHAGAIMMLADTVATSAAMWELDPDGASGPERFPLSIQMSTNLIRNLDRGALVADAELVHRGRRTLIAEVRVTDDHSRLIARATVTLLAPEAPAK
jgi:1,4-dihydroxy-2-naphthoyl-CoA hydrolase